MELVWKYLEIIMEWLLPLFKVAAVGTVAGIAAMGTAERLVPDKWGLRRPRTMRAVTTLLACGSAWAINFSDILNGFGTGPKSWALVIFAGVLGSYIAEAAHDSDLALLSFLKRKAAPAGGE